MLSQIPDYSIYTRNIFFRETHGTGVKYHSELAKQLSSFLEKVIEVNNCGGVFRTQPIIYDGEFLQK